MVNKKNLLHCEKYKKLVTDPDLYLTERGDTETLMSLDQEK